MKTLNGYEVVDAKAREDIKALTMGQVNLDGYAKEEYVDEAIAAIPKPDYTGLATEAYVDNAIDNIPEVDLSKHALKSEVPTKVSQLQNDSKFITRDEVPETDLSEYAKKSEIPDVSDFITNIPSEYITESELNAKGYLTQHQDLSSYAKKSEIPDISGKADKNHTHSQYLTEHQDISHLAPKSSIPTKVSQLANDSNYLTSIPSTYITEAELEAKNYLTEHQSLAAYATKTFVENTVAENQPNLSGYAKKSDIPDVSDFISEIPSEYVTDSELAAKKYATESYVGEAIAQAQLGGEDVDHSDYAKKADVPTKTSQLTNDSNFLTTIPSEYVTETELNNKGYLTQHQSLDEYAKKTEVPTCLSDLKNDVGFLIGIPEEYVTEAELEAKGYLTEHQSLDGKADKVHEHTEYANKTHNHSMADITDYVAPEIPEVEPTTFFLDFSAVTSTAQAATEAMVEFANYFKDNDNVSVYMRDSFDSDYYYPAVIQKVDTYLFNFLKASINLNNVAHNSALNWDIIRLISNDSGATWKYLKIGNDSTTIATKTYVDNAVANIDITESTPEVYHLDMRGLESSAFVNAPDSHIEVLNKVIAGDPICIYVRLSDMETWPARTCKYSDTSIVIETTPGHNTNTGDVYKVVASYSLENGVWKLYKTSPSTPRMVTEAELTSTLANYASTSYVDEAIAGIDTPEGGGKEVVELPCSSTFPTALQNKLKEIWLYGVAGNNILDKYDIYIIDTNNNNISCRANSIYCYGSETGSDTYKRFTVSAQQSDNFLFSCTLNPYTKQAFLNMNEQLATKDYVDSMAGSWQYDNSSDPNYCRWNFIGSARMVKLVGRVNGGTDHYATFEVASPNNSTIGSYTYHQVPNVLGVKSSENYYTYNYLQVYFSGDCFELQDPEGNDCSDHFTPECMYYMV